MDKEGWIRPGEADLQRKHVISTDESRIGEGFFSPNTLCIAERTGQRSNVGISKAVQSYTHETRDRHRVVARLK